MPRPDVQDTAMDFPAFHRLDQKEKREPRHPAASPIVTIKLIVDHGRLLFGDLTEVEFMRSTTLSFFPPGSRAAVSMLPTDNISDASVNGRHLVDVDTEGAGGSLVAETSTWWQILSKMTSPWIWGSVVTVTIVVALCTMMAGHGGASREQNFN